jgi:glycosyltransferase involved in cell wall biosynthesis
MNPPPRISIVVPSFNQGRYLGETLQSLIDQQYPDLEVIIQDGGSSDDSVAIAEDVARRFPATFRLWVEKDNGQADALNRGFARASGDVLGFLNSDDMLFPGILHRVADEIRPLEGRFVVMGRCLFTGEGSRYAGVEHPSIFRSHFDQLAIWKRGFNSIPQPSVFWHRSVWERCGGFDVEERHALDYDLFCRFSRWYRFHAVDELWSTYRMHEASKSFQRTESEVLEISIGVSRKHWGRWYSPLRWRCELSHWLYRRQLHDYACHHARRAEDAYRDRRYLAVAVESFMTLLYSPRMAWHRLGCAWLGRVRQGLLDRTLRRGKS